MSAMAPVLVCTVAMACMGATRCGAGSLEGIGGWEGDGFEQGYGFAMIGGSISASPTLSVPLRVNASYLYYNYADQGAVTRVSGPGGAALFGLRSTRPWGTLAMMTGGEIRWEKRDRDASSIASAAIARGGAVAQVDGDFAWSKRLRPFLLVSYSSSARYTYGRAGLRWQASNLDWSGPITWSFGFEGVGQGNADTDAVQGGAILECAIVHSRMTLSLRGGYKDSASPDGGRRQGGYVGAGFYRRF
jgi:hypothetical protein